MGNFGYRVLWLALCALLIAGCAGPQGGAVPADFLLIVDAESAEDPGQHVNVRIEASGRGRYERYETGGAIRGDADGVVTYDPGQMVEAGRFDVEAEALERLWRAIEAQHFFRLTEDYRMAIGHSYAFILVEADGRRHQVFNIGMEVPEIEALVAATERVLPQGVRLQYRAGITP
jgi:hypothetical protein